MTRKARLKGAQLRTLWLPDHVFHECGKAFVFSSVDIIIVSNSSFLLGIRRNEPSRNTWSLPGGIIRRGELREEAVSRIAKLETGLDIQIVRFLGTYDHIWPSRQYVSNCYIAEIKSGKLDPKLQSVQREFTDLRFFQAIPPKTHQNYTTMLEDAGWHRAGKK